MAVLSVQDIRDFVRNSLDTDITELPNALLDSYIYDASQRIDNFSRTWAFRAVDYSFTTTVNVSSYSLDTYAGLAGGAAPLQDVVDVRGPNFSLLPRDHRKMRESFRASQTNTAAQSQWFTVWGRTLYLWPAPSLASVYSVTGYRQATDWITTSSAPDFPTEFNDLLKSWALNRAYAFLDDPEMSAFFRDEFETELHKRSRRYLEGNDTQPLILNAGSAQSEDPWRTQSALGPLIYTWE